MKLSFSRSMAIKLSPSKYASLEIANATSYVRDYMCFLCVIPVAGRKPVNYRKVKLLDYAGRKRRKDAYLPVCTSLSATPLCCLSDSLRLGCVRSLRGWLAASSEPEARLFCIVPACCSSQRRLSPLPVPLMPALRAICLLLASVWPVSRFLCFLFLLRASFDDATTRCCCCCCCNCCNCCCR